MKQSSLFQYLSLIAVVTVAGILILWLSPGDAALTTQVINLILFAGLLVTTAYYAQSTAKLAKSTEQMATQMHEQMLASSRPIIWVRLRPSGASVGDVDLYNIGNGAAVHIHYLLESDSTKSVIRKGALALAVLRSGEDLSREIQIVQGLGMVRLSCIYQDSYGNWFRTAVHLEHKGGELQGLEHQVFEKLNEMPAEHDRAH